MCFQLHRRNRDEAPPIYCAFTSISSSNYDSTEDKYQAGQACLAAAPGPQFTVIPVREYQKCFALRPFQEPARTAAWLSRLQTSTSPRRSLLLFLLFLGMPANEYLERAKIVYDHRVPAWNLAIGVGGSCSSETARCFSNLRCVGPELQEQCPPQAPQGGACDLRYKLCKSELICRKGICMTQAQAFKGEEGDDCKVKIGRVCGKGLGCTSWNESWTGKCKKNLHLGQTCSIGRGRRCETDTSCRDTMEADGETRCVMEDLEWWQSCMHSVECQEGNECRHVSKGFRCRKPLA